MLTANFTPLTRMEDLKNLEGSGSPLDSRRMNLRSIVIFRVHMDLGYLL